MLIQDEEQIDYSKIEPSADFFAPPRGISVYFSL